jgi:hypothetical protein
MDNQKNTAKPIQELLTKQVNRTEFLTIVGFGTLAVFGLSPLIHFFTGKGGKTTIIHKHQNVQRGDFGDGPYGV